MDPESPTPPPKENRANKKRQQREQLSAVFSNDPLTRFVLPEPIRKRSAEVRNVADELDERIRKVSAASAKAIEKNDEAEIREYVGTRKRLASDVAVCVKRSKNMVEDLRSQKLIDQEGAEVSYRQLNELDAALLKERCALARNEIKLEFGILGHPSHARVGEAYLATLASILPEPAGARLKKSGKRDNTDQTNFGRRLRDAYYPPGWNKDPDKPRGWCPVTKAWTKESSFVAAHIVPYAIGEVNAAYLFGVEMDKGYRELWSTGNGLMLLREVEKALDAASLVIVPDDGEENEYKVVILDDDLMKKETVMDQTFEDIHNTRLEFRTDKRPSRRCLYLTYLLTLFRRRRFDVQGWERDCEKVSSGRFWGTPGPWLRRSVIQAIAFEIGDLVHYDDVIMNDAGLCDFPNQLSAEKEAGIAVEVRAAIEERSTCDDDKDKGGSED